MANLLPAFVLLGVVFGGTSSVVPSVSQPCIDDAHQVAGDDQHLVGLLAVTTPATQLDSWSGVLR